MTCICDDRWMGNCPEHGIYSAWYAAARPSCRNPNCRHEDFGYGTLHYALACDRKGMLMVLRAYLAWLASGGESSSGQR